MANTRRSRSINNFHYIYFSLFTIQFIFFSLIYAQELSDSSNRILYLTQFGEIKNAIDLYQKLAEEKGKHDRELLQKIALTILDQGSHNSDPEIQLLTMYGAGISINDSCLHILEEGLKSSYPQIQLVCLNLLIRFQHERAEESLLKAMNSPALLVRLECAYHLCENKSPSCVAQTEALMNKLNKELLPIFPQFYALAGNQRADKILRRFLSDKDERVRIEAIQAITAQRRDEFLPQIRLLASHHHIPQQEACASALGLLKDNSSIALLNKLSQSTTASVRLASLYSLCMFGSSDARVKIEELAKKNNLYAITLLGNIPESETILKEIYQTADEQQRLNVVLALLERRCSHCLPIISKILIPENRKIIVDKAFSRGNALFYWKFHYSSQIFCNPGDEESERSLTFRENLLRKCINLPVEDFLRLAKLILEANQNDLIPCLITLLEHLHSSDVISLLKKYQQKAGAPLIRNYCNLALYRLKEPGEYVENLKLWTEKECSKEFIRFRPLLKNELNLLHNAFQLTPQESSRLLIESFEAITQSKDDKGIDILLEAIKCGNPTNKYALAGLLIRAAE